MAKNTILTISIALNLALIGYGFYEYTKVKELDKRNQSLTQPLSVAKHKTNIPSEKIYSEACTKLSYDYYDATKHLIESGKDKREQGMYQVRWQDLSTKILDLCNIDFRDKAAYIKAVGSDASDK